jgi:hypothetical protein
MRLEPVSAPIGVDVVNWVIGRDGHYVPPWTLEDHELLEPVLDVAYRYGGEPGTVLVRTADGMTSAELSLQALRGRADAEAYRWLLLAQSEPDRDAILAPLARVQELGARGCTEQFGLTHLWANAAVDAVAMLSWLLAPGEQALLVLTDQRLLTMGSAAGDRNPARDSAVLLRVRHGGGGLRLIATGGGSWDREDFACAERFHARLATDVVEIRNSGLLGARDPAIAQSLYPHHRGATGAARSDYDLGPGDVWHQLAGLTGQGGIAEGRRVLLAATGGVRRVSYAVLETGADREHGR